MSAVRALLPLVKDAIRRAPRVAASVARRTRRARQAAAAVQQAVAAARPAPRRRRRPNSAQRLQASLSQPVAVSSSLVASISDPVHTVRGRQIVDTVSSDAGGALRFTNSPGSYDTDYALLIHPYAFFGAWAASMKTLYQRWRIKKLIVHYQPTCPTTTTGSLVMAISNDPGSVTAAGVYNASTISSLPNNIVSQVYTRSQLRSTGTSSWYYTNMPAGLSDTDLKIYSPGALVLDNNTTGATASLLMGQVVVEYELEFCAPAVPALA